MAIIIKPTYTVGEIARHLEVSRRTVERLISRGGLKAFKIGRATRIEHREIERFKSSNAIPVVKEDW